MGKSSAVQVQSGTKERDESEIETLRVDGKGLGLRMI
jgi:hypothetical protein